MSLVDYLRTSHHQRVRSRAEVLNCLKYVNAKRMCGAYVMGDDNEGVKLGGAVDGGSRAVTTTDDTFVGDNVKDLVNGSGSSGRKDKGGGEKNSNPSYIARRYLRRRGLRHLNCGGRLLCICDLVFLAVPCGG